jgi:hypothetical protein
VLAACTGVWWVVAGVRSRRPQRFCQSIGEVYGCKTWASLLRKNNRFREFLSRVLGRGDIDQT